MNPQYIPQQPQQYGVPPGSGYAPSQPGFPPTMQGANKPGGYSQPPSLLGPQRGTMPPGTHADLATSVPNGPASGPPSMPGSQQLRGPHTLAPGQLTSQMAGMNLGGPPRPPSSASASGSSQGVTGGPLKHGSGAAPPGYSPSMNGGPLPSQGLGPDPGGHPRGFVNGSMGPQPRGSLPPGMPPPSQGGLPSHGGMPPSQGGLPSHGGMPPPSQGGLPSHGGMPPSQGGLPSHGGMPPPSQGGLPLHGGMPPPSQGSLPSHGGMPPSQGGLPSHGGMPPPSQGGMPPSQGGLPSHGGMPPPSQGGLPSHGGMPPPSQGSLPSHGGMPPPSLGGLPSHGGMPPSQGGLPSHGGMPPPSQGGLPSHRGMPPSQGGLPSYGGMPPPSQGGLPSHGGMPPSHGGLPSHGGMPPPSQGGLPSPGGMPPPPSGGMPPMPPGAMAPQQHGGLPAGPGRLPYPQPGASPSADAGYAGGYSYSGQPQPHAQPARRLDPDQMPSPIQVMQDDQRTRSGVFYTNQKGQVPPLVTTAFVTQDQGNAGPRYVRSTMYNIPATIDMMKQTAVPFGLVLSPLACPSEEEYPPPVVDMGELGPVRCIRCKAYMCPFMQFIDGGRRFHCLFCKATTEVPAEYFQHLDHTGQRVDRFERPELTLGTYEFIATKDYCRNNTFPKPPALIFLIDVSYNNIKSGMVQLLCREMKDILKLLPRDTGTEHSTMRVGFITYNNTVHFYNIKGCLAQPQMLVVGDVQDMFMPLLEGFLCDPAESEPVIDSLMEQIPAMFADTRETETVLAPAIQAGLEALKASECAGKLLVFHSSLPIAEAPGKLKNRDERKLLGTEKEKTVLAPQVSTYNTLGQDCVAAGCSVDLFVFNNSYVDLATVGQVARLTGGEVFKYTYFQADLDGDRLIADIRRDVSRPVAFDAIMRVRTSTGVRATDFYGHFFMSNTTDMELASIDCDKAVAVEVKHDDKLTEEDGVYVQVALLYTSVGGQRRLRVLNLAFKTCSQMADLYRSCDLDSIINFFSKQVVFRLLEASPKPVKDGLVSRCALMLACYRKNCASPSSAGQLILPECMKLLPLYVNCILKSDAVSGGSDMAIDDRSFVMQAVTVMDVPSSVVYFYPQLLPLHDVDVNGNDMPAAVRCTADKIRDDGAYLLENGVHMFLWIGLNVAADWVQSVFGVHSAAQIDVDRTALPLLDNPLSQRLNALLTDVRRQRHRSMRLTLVRQRDKLEMVFKHFLVEDRGVDGSASYVDFLCHMHKEIRSLLS